MGNHAGKRLGYRQETMDDAMDRAKAECVFTERLYELLLALQRGEKLRGRHPEGIPRDNVGELNPEMSHLYNLIWASAVGLNDKAKSKPKKKDEQQMEAIAA